ncbi:Uncharacterised protein [uncultured archaeon]|nr:Uncharacterised protein [uncultured archaeon]
MLCNECYRKSEKVEMIFIGNVKPRSPSSKGAFVQLLAGEIIGKPKWKCPECGNIRVGRGDSWADMEEKSR